MITLISTKKFQPTPPARTETPLYDPQYKSVLISTHSAREDGDPNALTAAEYDALISTHSAREDGDSFLVRKFIKKQISTHSAREDGDIFAIDVRYFVTNFNPLRPRGRRPCDARFLELILFISTHSAREDGDNSLFLLNVNHFLFQPTPPARTETMSHP